MLLVFCFFLICLVASCGKMTQKRTLPKRITLLLSDSESVQLEKEVAESGLNVLDLIKSRVIGRRMNAYIQDILERVKLGDESQEIVRLRLSREERRMLAGLMEKTGLSAQAIFKYALFHKKVVARKSIVDDLGVLEEVKSALKLAQESLQTEASPNERIKDIEIVIEGIIESIELR